MRCNIRSNLTPLLFQSDENLFVRKNVCQLLSFVNYCLDQSNVFGKQLKYNKFHGEENLGLLLKERLVSSIVRSLYKRLSCSSAEIIDFVLTLQDC